MAKLGVRTGEPGFQYEPFVLIGQAVASLFADMERRGELD